MVTIRQMSEEEEKQLRVRSGGGRTSSKGSGGVTNEATSSKPRVNEAEETASFCSSTASFTSSSSQASAASAVVVTSPPPSPPGPLLASTKATKAAGEVNLLRVTKVNTNANLVTLSNGETWQAPAIEMAEPKVDGDPPVTRNAILSTSKRLSIETS